MDPVLETAPGEFSWKEGTGPSTVVLRVDHDDRVHMRAADGRMVEVALTEGEAAGLCPPPSWPAGKRMLRLVSVLCEIVARVAPKEIDMDRAIRLFVFGVVLGSGLMSCRPQTGGPTWPTRAISCSAEVVSRQWATAYPHVQTCLTSRGEGLACLDAIPVAVGVAVEVVACIVRSSGSEAASMQEMNPADVVSVRRAERARAWIESRGLVFE